MPKTKKEKERASKILAKMRRDWELAVEYELDDRKRALEDLKYRVGEQWPDDIKLERFLDRRPCLTINRLPQFVHQVTNDERQNRPNIKVNPTSGGARIEIAKIYQGMIRHICNDSSAEIAFDVAGDCAATIGFGYYRVVPDFESPMSFDQILRVELIRNPFSVYLDPYHQHPDGSDARWGFVFTNIQRDEFEELFPDAELTTGAIEYESDGDKVSAWISEESVRIVEYYYKDYEEKEIWQLSNNQVIEASKVPLDEEKNPILAEGITVVRKRTTRIPTIRWIKSNGYEILEETELRGHVGYIPIIEVLGDCFEVEGKIHREGVIRHAKDSQRMYNYWASAETEMIALAPKAPYIGAEGQFEGHEEEWKDAPRRNLAYLEYKPKTLNGETLPAPTRNTFEPPVAAINSARLACADDLKATTGIYDASLGARSNEQTGKAILARQQQGQISNFHFIANASRSVVQCGRILGDMLPFYYDTRRIAQMLDDKGVMQMVEINNTIETENGEVIEARLIDGRYEIVMDAGPNYQTKRQEATATMLELARNSPAIIEQGGDILVRNMDWEGAQELADRLAPPEEGKLPPQVINQMRQMEQMIKQMGQALEEALDKRAMQKDQIESNERVNLAKIRADIIKTAFTMNSKEGMALFNAELKRIDSRAALLEETEPVDSELGGNAPSGDPGQPADPAM